MTMIFKTEGHLVIFKIELPRSKVFSLTSHIIEIENNHPKFSLFTKSACQQEVGVSRLDKSVTIPKFATSSLQL